jgi:hypothetical protein
VVSPCKPCAERRREQFRSQPWRVSYDDIESPSREYIRKVTLVVKPRDFSIAGKLAPGTPYLTKPAPEPDEVVSRASIQTASLPKEVMCSRLL